MSHGNNLACHGVLLGRIACFAIRLKSPPDGEVGQGEDTIRDQAAIALPCHPLNSLQSHRSGILDIVNVIGGLHILFPKNDDILCVPGAEAGRKRTIFQSVMVLATLMLNAPGLGSIGKT